MIIGIEQYVFDLAQKLSKGFLLTDLDAQREKIYTMPNKISLFQQALSRGRNTDNDVILIAKPVKQRVETGEQRGK